MLKLYALEKIFEKNKKLNYNSADYTDFSLIALPPRPTKILNVLIIKRIEKQAGFIGLQRKG